MVAAIAKARSLANHLTGSDPSQAVVTLTDREARELIAHMRTAAWNSEAIPAGAESDPWGYLAGWRLMGFPLERIAGELH